MDHQVEFSREVHFVDPFAEVLVVVQEAVLKARYLARVPLPDEVRSHTARYTHHMRDDVTPKVCSGGVTMEEQDSLVVLGGQGCRVQVAHVRFPYIGPCAGTENLLGSFGHEATTRGMLDHMAWNMLVNHVT